MTFTLPLHVEVQGLPPADHRPTFLLLHGYGASSFSFRTLAPALAERGTVVLVDLKGFGSAPHPDDGRYGPADHAELVVRLLAQRGYARVTLVGHSFGGSVALLTALRLIDSGDPRLHRLILVAGAAYRQRLPPFVSLARWPRLSLAFMRVLGPRRVARLVLRTIVHDRSTITRAQVEGYADPLSRPGVRRTLIDTARAIVPPDVDELVRRYPEIDVPTLLLWGRHDRVVPLWVGERLQRELPRARLCVLDDCGHVPLEERPQEAVRAVVAFLDATRDAGGAEARP